MYIIFQAGTEDGCVALFDVTKEGVEYKKALDKQEGGLIFLHIYLSRLVHQAVEKCYFYGTTQC